MHFKIRGSKARQIKEERHIINHSMILYFIKPRTPLITIRNKSTSRSKPYTLSFHKATQKH
jgi:hypothetical protein